MTFDPGRPWAPDPDPDEVPPDLAPAVAPLLDAIRRAEGQVADVLAHAREVLATIQAERAAVTAEVRGARELIDTGRALAATVDATRAEIAAHTAQLLAITGGAGAKGRVFLVTQRQMLTAGVVIGAAAAAMGFILSVVGR